MPPLSSLSRPLGGLSRRRCRRNTSHILALSWSLPIVLGLLVKAWTAVCEFDTRSPSVFAISVCLYIRACYAYALATYLCLLYLCLLFVFAMFNPCVACLFGVGMMRGIKTPLIRLGLPIDAMHALTYPLMVCLVGLWMMTVRKRP